MAQNGNGHHRDTSDTVKATWTVKSGLAQMLKGGVIMDVVTVAHAKIAEEAGAVAVMALERVPSDIRKEGGVARMSDPQLITEIMGSVTIPVMAKARIGHFVEAQVLQALGVDYVDESEVLTPADEKFHIDKKKFDIPFVCGARDLGEALRRISEGAAMIRSKGEAGTGNVVEAVRHIREIVGGIEADAARCRGQLRGQRHLQSVRGSNGPAPPGQGDRRGHDTLQRSQAHCRGLARARAGDARHRARVDPRGRTSCRPRLVIA